MKNKSRYDSNRQLSGRLTFHEDGQVVQSDTTGIQREGEIALDFNISDDSYNVVLKRDSVGSFVGEFRPKSDRLIGLVNCRAYLGTGNTQVSMGNWTEEGRTYFWFAKLEVIR
jgi:hypothetical protein